MRSNGREALKRIAKGVIHTRQRHIYHTGHARKARSVLEVVEGDQGRTHARQLQACNEYAVDVLGWSGYAPWLYVYTAVSGKFIEGWIPDNYYGEVVLPALNGEHGRVSSLKSITNQIFRSPCIPDIAMLANGLIVTPNGAIIDHASLREFLFSDDDRVVFKRDGSGQGLGVVVLSASDFAYEAVARLGNGVMQRYVHQHPTLAALCAASVATIRITTASDDAGIISVRAAYLRLGVGHDTHVKSASSVRVPLDLVTGGLQERGYLANWRSVVAHPDSGVAFAGVVLPSFRACLDVVVGLHMAVPYVRCIGWDVTVDAQGEIAVLEWNGDHNDIKFSEAVSGPCFSDLGWERLWRTGRSWH